VSRIEEEVLLEGEAEEDLPDKEEEKGDQISENNL
jgi:hypothetical protein